MSDVTVMRADECAAGTARSSAHPLDRILRPASVVVVGASPDATKRGHRAVRALCNAGFRGRVIPVHPGGGELFGHPVARGAADVDAPPDLVLVCTPAPTVPGVLEEWASAGAAGAVVLAAGFGESGETGDRLEQSVREVVARTGIRVIGVNTSGILNVPLGLNLIGVDGVARGPVSVLVQSGNIALALLAEAARARLGFGFVIGVGNETDVAFHEYLDFLAGDDGTRAILVHAEGFRDGAAFLAAACRASHVKPVVMIKGARTAHGSVAARSHTGAIAGSYAALRAGLRQAGVIEVRRTDELLPVAATLVAQRPLPPGRGIAILSDGGGHATIAVDDLHEHGLSLATLEVATADRLRELLGPAAAVRNPVDLAGAADRDPLVFARVLDALAEDASVGAVLVVGLFGGYAMRFAESLLPSEVEAARRLADTARRAPVALVVHSLYAECDTEPLRILRDADVPVIGVLENACRCVAAIAERAAAIDRRRRMRVDWPAAHVAHRASGAAPGRDGAMHDGRGAESSPIVAARREGRTVLLETEARALAEHRGLALVPARFCATDAETRTAAEWFDGSLAIRVVAASAPHKTEAGGVALNVTVSDAERIADELKRAVRSWCRHRGMASDVRGVLVSPMLERPVAELLVGIVRDAQFGPVLTVGAGGTWAELHRDVATRVLPVVDDEVREMLAELRIAPVLAGHRGAPGADTDAVVRAVMALASCALAHPDISEIEVNPVFAYEDRAIAVDVRIFIG